MLYEQYYKKILKVKKKRDFLYRYRYAFISLWTTAAVISGSLFSLKGYVVNETFFSKVLTYGETYQPIGSAVFDQVLYEYAPADQDVWQTESPVWVGDYKARGKSENNFGEFYYGDTFYFTIQPKPLQIQFKEAAVLYGSKPSLDLQLAFDDQVQFFDVLYDDFRTQETMISIDLDTFKIIDVSGQDVTYCYDVFSEKTSLRFFPRPLNFNFLGGTKIYDGIALQNDNFTSSGSLAFDDYYVIGDAKQQLVIGQTLNIRDVSIFNRDDLDVTHLYNLKIEAETLTVAARPLTITSSSASKIYDGSGFPDETFQPIFDSSLLLPGHQLQTSFIHETTFTITNTNNVFTYVISDENNEVVTSLYDLNVSFGTFVISQRPITLTANSASKVYDQNPLVEPTYQVSEGTLANTDRIESTCNATITRVGKIANNCTYSIIHETNLDVKNNYALNQIPGELLIEKRPIVITMEAISKVYDGEMMIADQYTYVGDLVVGHRLNTKEPPATLRNVGKINNSIQFEVIDENDIDVTNNYEITLLGTQGSLEILKRPLTIQANSETKAYDATNLVAPGYTIISGSLAEQEVIEVRFSPNLKNVGSLSNTLEIVIFNEEISQVVTANYDLELIPGALTVEKTSTIVLTSLDDSKTYDDQPYTSTNLNLVNLQNNGPFVNEQVSLTNVRLTSAQTNVGIGEITIDPTSIVLKNTANEDITKNYHIQIINSGNLTVNQREIYLTMTDLNRDYNGQPLVANNTRTISPGGALLPGHQISFSNPEIISITNVDEGPKSTITSVSIFKQNIDVSANYKINEFTITEGSLTLNLRKITIRTSNADKTYDGAKLMYTPTATVVTTGPTAGLSLAPGHTVQATFNYFEPINASSAPNIASFKILDASANDVTRNYEITPEFGEILVKQRLLNIGLRSTNSIYDGTQKGYQIPSMLVTPTSSPLFIRTGSSLPNGFTMTMGVTALRTLAGYEPISIQNTVVLDGQGNNIDINNFDIRQSGGVSIFQRELVIKTDDAEINYTGEAFSNEKSIIFGELASGDRIEYQTFPPMIERGTYINRIGEVKIYNSRNEDVTGSYKITLIEGQVIIQ